MSQKALQALVVNCMLMGVLYASDTNAQQIRSVKDVVVKFHVENSALERVLRSIEEQTDFEFTYRKEDVDPEFLFSGKFTKASVADVLLEISRQTDLKFKQVNNNIHISKKSSDTRSDKEIEIVIQGITITGKVTSSEDDQGLPGVNVIVKGTSQGTVTDVEGNYSLDVPGEETVLVF
ncbi:MAG: carboxypeptidase-like regulatory domain-containing protein, partial [Cytophagales bacterium]|nr:carboxypeptidase-like regulatory domain-containing protein [Cytophagales bacterium]